eukprot:TRINITY_DN7665_c0_g1_i2.p1 TRINITY_DN7665_c0_g1~~TRINITY_DN7665_c0_g1_i2.p1  ORF type:complete len:346 (+),score=101.82 TRINITY_DN7665_c0_g1_i2:64-1101(+)
MSRVVEGKGFFKEATVEDFPPFDVITIDTGRTLAVHVERYMFDGDGFIETLIKDAFDTLTSNKIHSAPVFNKQTNKYDGFFDVADMVVYVIEALRATSGPDVEVPDTFANVQAIIEWVHRHDSEAVANIVNISQRNPFKSLSPSSDLLAALELLGNKGLKRLPVVDLETGKVAKLISQSTLNRYLLQHEAAYASFGQDTVGQIAHFHKDVISVAMNAPALRAFELIMKHDISAIAVTEPVARSKRVVGTISDTDMKAIVQKQNFSLYQVTVEKLLRVIRPDKVNFVLSVTDKTKLADIPSMLEANRVHRVYVVDYTANLTGVITFKELMAELLVRVKKEYVDWSQ